MKINAIYKKRIDESVNFECEPFIGENGKYYLIYKISFPCGKYYIGEHMTKNIFDGYCGSGALLPYYFKKYKIEDVRKTILSCHKSKKDMENEEKKVIGTLYKTDEKCINLIPGGSLGFSEHMVESSVKKRKGKKRSPESIEKQRISCTGKIQSEETKKKQSEWHKNFWNSEAGIERREKMSSIQKGRKMTNEQKEKLSKAKKIYFDKTILRINQKIKYYGDDFLQDENFEKVKKILENGKIRLLNDDEKSFIETVFLNIADKRKKRKRDLAMERKNEEKRKRKKYVFTDEHKKHLSESMKGRKLSNERKKKCSERMTGRGNVRYIPKQIDMLDMDGKVLSTFKDCIDVIDYLKKNVNEKASNGEIFIACRTGKTRYGHKWRFTIDD